MRRSWLLLAFGLLVAALSVGAIACEDDEKTAEENVDQLCSDLGKLDEALFNLAALGPTNTVDDLRAARDDVANALEDVRDSARDVAEDRANDIQSAYDDLNQAVSDVPGDATVAEGLVSIARQLAAVQQAEDSMSASLGCAQPDDGDGAAGGAEIEVDGTVVAGVTLAILSPEDGSTVTSPVTLTVAVGGGVVVEAAEDKEMGAVHYFASVDGAQATLAEGTTVARGEEQAGVYQWSAGSVELDLPPGEHTVIVGFADNEDSIVDTVQAQVTFTVE